MRRLLLLPLALLVVACGHAGHGLRDRHAHAPRSIETYIARLESPTRVEALQIDRVLETLRLDENDTVADIGSGPGVFSIPLARKLPQGLVYAVDVEPLQLDALRARAKAAGLSNVVPVLASLDDPFLPEGRIDLALVVDTFHHIRERAEYFQRLQRAFAPAGRLVIIEWKPGDLGRGPPPEHKLAEGVRRRELEQAGYALTRRFDFHELHDFEIWQIGEGSNP